MRKILRGALKFIIPVFLLIACNQQQEQKPQNNFAPKVVEIKGYVVPKDSMAKPEVILLDESKLTKILTGKPEVILAKTNVHIAGVPKVVIAGSPQICTPGKDTFLLPKAVPAIDSPFIAGIPEVLIAKDANIREHNPQNFSSFSKLQGLKNETVSCMLEDKKGNLWFGTYGGVCKYDGKSFTNFTEKEGLINNNVWSIFQDKSENIWIGTTKGISKYDGKTFTNYSSPQGLTNDKGFVDPLVFAFLQDKNGNIWVGTYRGGVSKYDGKSFTNYTVKEGLINDNVRSIFQDNSGNIWFGTDGGVSKYDGKSFTNFTEKEGLSNNAVWSIIQDKSGNIWFGTYGGGMSKLTTTEVDGSFQYTFTNFTEKEGLAYNVGWTIFQDKSENIWFGTNGGGVSKLTISKVEGNNIYTFTNFDEDDGLSNDGIRSILQDKRGNLWFGTFYGGVSKYDGKSFTSFTTADGLSNEKILSILQDKSGNIWFGSYLGVCKFDGKSFTNFTVKEGLINNIVRSIFQDKSGNLWFGTNSGISMFDGKFFTNFKEESFSSIIQDKAGNIWFNSKGLNKYDGKYLTTFTEKEGLPFIEVSSIIQDKSDNVWVGTNGGGISKLSITKVNGCDTYTFTNFTKKEGFINNFVKSIIKDKSGNLWFSTLGGVCKYDGKYFSNYTEKEGLSNNSVNCMLQDKKGNLWFGTSFGLNKLKVESLKSKDKNPEIPLFKYYGYEDGFLGIGVNGRNSICEANDGTIWIGSNDRLTAYHPEGDEPDTIPPNIQLTSIELFNENIAWVNLETKDKSKKIKNESVAADTSFVLGNGVRVGDFKFDGISKWYSLPENLSLAYNNNYLTFNFIGITQLQSKKVKYKYKLEGIDENWSAITNRTEAPYGNLPQGSYTFKVKAMNSEGYWSNEFNYSFIIRPPWWKTWWFRTILGISGILLIFSYLKWRERKLKKDKLLLEKKVKEQTHELSEKNEELNQQNEEITAQKDEIETQRDEIMIQRDLVTNQKEHIEEIHKDLTDSINYAERIQRSFLATKELLDENLKEHFVIFHPKDVVSGDFYWASKIVNSSGVENFVLATADSTGHGVPGAIMSILNISSLEKAVEQGIYEPSEILNHTRNNIIERLKKDGSAEGGKDGMDASLICFDFASRKFKYSAANNPIWIIRENNLIELSPDKMPVGKHVKDHLSFTQHEFQIQENDLVYTFTDGLPDQFGGPKGRKFMYKPFKELLLANCEKPMLEQKEMLEKALNDWKGDNKQIDDITVIGIRIN